MRLEFAEGQFQLSALVVQNEDFRGRIGVRVQQRRHQDAWFAARVLVGQQSHHELFGYLWVLLAQATVRPDKRQSAAVFEHLSDLIFAVFF
jgi:hypothetical protein